MLGPPVTSSIQAPSPAAQELAIPPETSSSTAAAAPEMISAILFVVDTSFGLVRGRPDHNYNARRYNRVCKYPKKWTQQPTCTCSTPPSPIA